MSHTTKLDDHYISGTGDLWSAIHNGDPSPHDTIEFVKMNYDGKVLERYKLPYCVVRVFVAEMTRNNNIRMWEELSTDEILVEKL